VCELVCEPDGDNQRVVQVQTTTMAAMRWWLSSLLLEKCLDTFVLFSFGIANVVPVNGSAQAADNHQQADTKQYCKYDILRVPERLQLNRVHRISRVPLDMECLSNCSSALDCQVP
jgi:hypothetical protein